HQLVRVGGICGNRLEGKLRHEFGARAIKELDLPACAPLPRLGRACQYPEPGGIRFEAHASAGGEAAVSLGASCLRTHGSNCQGRRIVRSRAMSFPGSSAHKTPAESLSKVLVGAPRPLGDEYREHRP